MRRWNQTLSMAAILVIAGCGGDDFPALTEGPPDAAVPDVGNSGPAYDPATATATVSGTIRFEGSPPEMPFLDMGSDFYCQRVGTGQLSKEVMVGDDGALVNVIVYVRSGHDQSLAYRPSTDPVVLDQDRCVYTPRVLSLMTGQELLIRNGDATLHNVHADAGSQTLFNFAQPSGPQEDIEIFQEPGLPIHIGCDLHRWMDTYLGVFDHPFHAVTDTSGRFTLDLPPGSYELAAWHERYGEQVVTLDLVEGQDGRVDFTFTEDSPN
jgi:plastocyanin